MLTHCYYSIPYNSKIPSLKLKLLPVYIPQHLSYILFTMGITSLHEDIIQTHILTRLDGRSLAAAGCASSHLQSLCSGGELWSNICSSSWPSTEHPLVSQAILNFKSGHRSFFSDVFPSPSECLCTASTLLPPTANIISSVDLRYRDQMVFSNVESTSTTPSDWFLSCPFRIDLLEHKELVQLELEISGDDQVIQSNLEKHMTLSWIMIDPAQNRAINLSSTKPVSVHRNLLTDEIELTFSVVTSVNSHVHNNEHVNCNIEVTCGVKEGSLELYVSGMSFTIHDINGKCLSGKDSMVILQGLTVAERRWRNDGGGWQKEMYDEYIQRRKERKEKMERRERRLDLIRVGCAVAFLMAFWSLALFLII
ncbi:putative F-box-like domain superfamily protein [Helianthus annuus]|nr:putative F-box-like domain superfamily protein [Helianthus annuus]KAJ0832156.1 putative F-box-like domain superfamily protein [Helianthus annuus]